MAARRTSTCLVLFCAIFMPASAERPNIVVIIADDLGWNDVGFHGSNQIPTPNIDALAYSGLLLQNYYVTPICTPSRAAFMTGKYPIHTGMQHSVLYGMETRGLPLSEKLLPQYLKELGYKTHLVGKWHLGLYTREYLPLNRGFDSHLGFWTGRIDMYDHTSMENGSWGFDFRRGYAVADDLFGKYATDVYTDEAVKVINQHNQSTPLFLMIGHSAMHSGNPNEPIRAPDKLIDKFADIKDYQRRKYAAVLTKLDESVGSVMTALQKRGLLANSIVLFTTDNGGAAAGFNDNAASNWPLRGVKNTLWEGGIRGAGFLWSPLLRNQSRVATQSVQISDWLPTLLSAAGGNVSALGAIDGFDQWQALSSDLPSPRESIVHNIDDVWGSAALSVGKWKLVKGTNYNGSWDAWYGPAGRGGSYDAARVRASRAAAALAAVARLPSAEQIQRMREAATVSCDSNTPSIACEPLKSPCVFNLEEDPCERRNLADENPEMLQILLKMLQEANNTAVPPNNTPLDRRGDPKFWGRIYTNFGDYKTNSLSGNGVLS